MPAVQETVDQVRRIDVDQYKYGFETRHRIRQGPEGPDRGHRPLHLGEEGRARMDARMAARRLSPLADHARADLGARRLLRRSTIRTSTTTPRRSSKAGPKSLDEVDPEMLETYEKLGIPLREQEMLPASAQAARTARRGRQRLRPRRGRRGVRFRLGRHHLQGGARQGRRHLLPISEAMREHPELVKKYLGTVVPVTDNFFATLNSAVFSDGSFVYVPPGVRCPMELSTYFRINEQQHRPVRAHADHRRQGLLCELSRRLHRADARREPAACRGGRADRARRRRDQVFDRAELVSGRRGRQGGIYNFVTKRGDCRGERSKISWTQVETGSAITWKYPSCILRGDNSRGEFYSIAISNGHQQVDSGTKMIHLGKNTTSRIISKGIAAGHSQQHLSRPRLGAPQGHGRAQLHQLRLAADRRQVRRAHRALHRGEEFLGRVRARGDDLEDLRGPAVLLPAARALGGGGGRARSSTASSRTCCSSCRWSSRSRRRS